MDDSLPFEISKEIDDSDIDSHRTLSIVKYVTDVVYNPNEIISKFSRNRLNCTAEFGCVDPKIFDDHVHVLFGKLGTKTLTGLNTDSDNNTSLMRYSFKNVIIATMYIDHFSEDNNLSLIVFHGGKISTDLWHATYRNLLNIYDIRPVKFSERKIKKMCFEKYQDNLLEIKFDPASEEEFGNVKFAEYKSVRYKKFNPNAKKYKKLRKMMKLK